jgi:hypothetical protein
MARKPPQMARRAAQRRNLSLSDTPRRKNAQIGAQPKCAIHGTLCAYPGPHPALCPFCHATWARITAPAVPPVWGYGQTATQHLAGHMAEARRRRRPRRTQ